MQYLILIENGIILLISFMKGVVRNSIYFIKNLPVLKIKILVMKKLL
jgi:hypothetical protein